MRDVRALVVISCLALLSGACSGDDSDEEVAGTTAMAETTAPPATTAAPATTAPDTTTPTPQTSAPPLDQAEALAGLPWASPDSAHRDPRAAVEAFVAWVATTRPGTWTDGSYEIGEFAAGDARSGEVVVRSTLEAGPTPMVVPTTTVLVRQAGADDTWWVLGAIADTLRVDDPAADAVVESPLRVTVENTVVSDPVQIRLYVDAVEAPLVETTLSGSGVFAMGTFDVVLGGGSPAPGVDPIDDWDGPPGSAGTLVVSTNWGLTTVPVTFAG